jgi:NADH-quinone oxidoreductase subunit J
MNASTVIFYILAATVIAGGLLAVTSRKIFRSAVFLLFSLVGIAGFYFLLDYEFIAAVQIVVYVGGIVVLLIFSIFLTHGSGEDMKSPHIGRAVFAALSVATGCILTMFFIYGHVFTKTAQPAIEPSAQNIGAQMLSTTEHGYILPFEVVSMLLLASMIGCIVIAIKVKMPAHAILPEKEQQEESNTIKVVEEIELEPELEIH